MAKTKELCSKVFDDISEAMLFSDASWKRILDELPLLTLRQGLEVIVTLVQENEVNDNLSEWLDFMNGLVNNRILKVKDVNKRAAGWIVFCSIMVEEIAIQGGGGSSLQGAKQDIYQFRAKFVDKRDENKRLVEYLSSFYFETKRFRFMEARVLHFYNLNVDAKVKEALSKEERRLENIERELESANSVMSSLESNVGFSSLFEGFSRYSKEVRGKLRELKSEAGRLKQGLLFTPPVLALLALAGVHDIKVFACSSALMLVLGLLMKVNLKRQDQYEQILSRIETKLAIAVFHRYEVQSDSLQAKEKENANIKFHDFMYADIETSEWQVPDISDGIVKIAREFSKKSS